MSDAVAQESSPGCRKQQENTNLAADRGGLRQVVRADEMPANFAAISVCIFTFADFRDELVFTRRVRSPVGGIDKNDRSSQPCL
jgi:hypothetical protein